MPHSKALDDLRAAIRQENATAQQADAAYVLLLDKIVDYQNGIGEPPSDSDFATWREAAMRRTALHAAGLLSKVDQPIKGAGK